MEEKEFTFKFDELKLQAERDSFIDWIRNSMKREVKKSDIVITCDKEGKFFLSYRIWNHEDQIQIKKICYPNSSIDMVIELNTRTTYNVEISKKVIKER